MIAAALWMLLLIGYDHSVHTSFYPTEAACLAAISPRLANVRDSSCQEIP